MSQPELTTREVYARHTGVDGNSYVSSHVVWDAALFFGSRSRQAADANRRQKDDQPRLAKCEQITPEQYRNERKART